MYTQFDERQFTFLNPTGEDTHTDPGLPHDLHDEELKIWMVSEIVSRDHAGRVPYEDTC